MSPTLPPEYSNISDSSDSLIVSLSGPGDTTVRPLTGKALESALREKEKLERYRKEKEERLRREREQQQPPPSEPPPA